MYCRSLFVLFSFGRCVEASDSDSNNLHTEQIDSDKTDIVQVAGDTILKFVKDINFHAKI
jgi:hypothetical protein